MTKLFSVFAFATFAALSAQASQINVKGTWGADDINWSISGNEQQQTWNLITGSAQKVMTVTADANGAQINTADGKSALKISYAAGLTGFQGQLDGRAVDLNVEHTNNGTLWFKGVFKNHRPSLRIDLPGTQTIEGRATGFFKNELADLYIVPQKFGYWLKGYMNGYWIDVIIKKDAGNYTFEGAYMSKKMNLVVTADTAIDDVIEYLLLDMPIPNQDFLNLKNENF